MGLRSNSANIMSSCDLLLIYVMSATTSGKISSGTKMGLRSNFANITSSCDLLLIYIVPLNNVKH
jgi:hypothetical protein